MERRTMIVMKLVKKAARMRRPDFQEIEWASGRGPSEEGESMLASMGDVDRTEVACVT